MLGSGLGTVFTDLCLLSIKGLWTTMSSYHILLLSEAVGEVPHALLKTTGSSLDLHLQLGGLLGHHSWAAPGGVFCNAHEAACPQPVWKEQSLQLTGHSKTILLAFALLGVALSFPLCCGVW